MRNSASPELGVLTLATPSDYLKAIGLALSLRASNPGLPTAVACSERLKSVLSPYFNHVIPEYPELRGFEHKVYLDKYSPFERTFYFDSDVLVFKALSKYVEEWKDPSYTAVGTYVTEGTNSFGLDRRAVLQRIGRSRLVVIDGAGHAYFRKPECQAVFDLARHVTENYQEFAPGARYADEDAVGISMTLTGCVPAPYGDFFSRHLSARPGTLEMDAGRAHCRFIWADTGRSFEPCMMHFAMNEAPFAYTRQLMQLYRYFGVPTTGLISLGLSDFWISQIKWPLSRAVKRILPNLRSG
jgi:hypothetical protein